MSVGSFSVVVVIETEVPPGGELSLLTADDLASRITSTHAELVERETRMLQLACAWADVHDIDSTAPHYQPLIERACIFGGDGTPEVSEHCVAEFGALQQQGLWAGRLMIADALDLRHRLPQLWRLVECGSVRAWVARRWPRPPGTCPTTPAATWTGPSPTLCQFCRGAGSRGSCRPRSWSWTRSRRGSGRSGRGPGGMCGRPSPKTG